MGRDIKLPKREKDQRSELTELQMVFLDCYLLQVTSPRLLFRYLIAPSKSEKDSLAMMGSLLKNSDAVAYMERRKDQLHQYYFGEHFNPAGNVDDRPIEEIQKTIVEKATRDLLNAMEDDTANIKNGAIIEKILIKALDVDSSTINKPEPARIYLPESCDNCRYRKFCEDPDNVEDECLTCRYRQDSLDKGVEYDNKTQFKKQEICQ